MQAVYGDKYVDVMTVSHWAQQFKQDEVGEASLFDKESLGKPVTAADKSHQERFEEMTPKKFSNYLAKHCSYTGNQPAWFLKSLCQVGTMEIA
jgi:hypothetical protein